MFKHISSEPIIFLYATINVINLSILPQLILQKVCLNSANGNGTSCQSADDYTLGMKKETSHWWFATLASSQIPSIFTVLIWGPISDVIGRKKAVLVVPLVSIIQNIIFVLCSHYINSSLVFLCLGNSLAAFFGEFPGVIALCYGFIADATSKQKMTSRISRMAFIDCAINLAGVPAGLFAGQLLKQVGFTAVFGLSIGVNLVLLAYILFFIPSRGSISEQLQCIGKVSGQEETLEKNPDSNKEESEMGLIQSSSSDNIKPINWDLFKPHKQIYLVYKLVTSKERRNLILPPLVAFIFIMYGFVGEVTINSLYLKSNPLSLSPDYVGYYYASQATIRGLGVVLTTQIAERVFKVKDVNLLLFGVFSQIVCYILIAFSKNTLEVFVANVIGFAVPVGMSLSRSYTSKHVPPEQVGTLMAAFESIDALSFTTNLISIEVYNATLESFSGGVFLFLAGCTFIGFCTTIGNKIYLSNRVSTPLEESANDILDSCLNNDKTADALRV